MTARDQGWGRLLVQGYAHARSCRGNHNHPSRHFQQDNAQSAPEPKSAPVAEAAPAPAEAVPATAPAGDTGDNKASDILAMIRQRQAQ